MIKLSDVSSSRCESCLQIMKRIGDGTLVDIEDLDKHPTIEGRERGLNLGLEMGLFIIDTTSGCCELTEDGLEINCLSLLEQRREFLKRLSRDQNLPFGAMLAGGRKRVSRKVNGNLHQMIRMAGLFEDSKEAKFWWLSMRSRKRSVSEEERQKTGLEGEEKTLEYEKTRTGRPEMVSHDSIDVGDHLGYDVLSVVDSDDQRRLRIESKASKEPIENALLYLTRHEWEIANESGEHLFHLWPDVYNSEGYPIEVTVDEMREHVSTDQGSGRWGNVEIPMREFFVGNAAE